eukprot:gene30822-38099_t
MRGIGELTLSNGDVYTGLFHKDYLYGHGSVKYATGGQFIGEFDHFGFGDVGNDSFP